MARSSHCSLALAAVAAIGCGKDDPTPRASDPGPAAAAAAAAAPAAPACDLEPIPLRYPAADRVVAIGDIHGDLAAARAALRLAGAIDADDHWIGGKLVVVQTGDVLDRGDDEPEILALFERLAAEAGKVGGRAIRLNGNHELMNAAGDFRYVTPGGFADFVPMLGDDAALAAIPSEQRGRAAAFAPGGAWARRLAGANTIAIVGSDVFVHGGVLPAYAASADSDNLAVRCWLAGRGPRPALVEDSASPVWSRDYAMPPEPCEQLARSLSLLGATRMIVGHTTSTDGITSACGDRVWRIDVGLAAAYGGPLQVLELRPHSARIVAGAR